MQKSISHFFHPQHSLMFYKGHRKPWRSYKCFLCEKINHSIHPTMPVYGCRECRFKIHLDCAQLPQELTHPFHPQHSLSLSLIPHINKYIPPLTRENKNYLESLPTCNACGRDSHGRNYVCSCAKCKFNLHIQCMKLRPINDDQLKHQKISHQHPVFVCNQPIDFESNCSFCESSFSEVDLIYVCVDCKQLLHETCIFPQEIMHPFHPMHPLSLVPPPHLGSTGQHGRSCNACSKCSNSYFTCSQCAFFLDLSCISLKPTCKSSEYNQELQNQPLPHMHPLIQCDPIKKQPPCFGCHKPIKDSIYVCLECGILLDKSCAQLPPEITSPFHPIHPLTLSGPYWGTLIFRVACNVCYNDTPFLMYECTKCDFVADTRCANSTEPYAMVKSRIHSHPLAFFIEPGYDWGKACNGCGESCTKYFFSCPKCEYCIHLECVPSLPRVIEHDCHCDPLIFTASVIKDASDEDSEEEEFYCHACEELRDIDDPTYYCKECHFVAHLQCVFPAILRALESEPTASPTHPLLSPPSLPYPLVPEPTESSSQESQQGIAHEEHVGVSQDLKGSL